MIASTVRVLRSVANNWEFARAMAARETTVMTRGAVLGIGWLLLRPLAQGSLYVLIVGFVFNVRHSGGTYDLMIFVLSGLVIWQAMQKPLEEAPGLLRDRMDFIKQMPYPVETLPITAMLVNAWHIGAGFSLFLVLALLTGNLGWSIFLLPIPMALMVMMLVGMSWVMMVVGLLVKDLREFIPLAMSFLIYFSPALVGEAMVGPMVWTAFMLNPFSHVIIPFRDVIQGDFHPWSWGIFSGMAFGACLFGAWLIDHVRRKIYEYI